MPTALSVRSRVRMGGPDVSPPEYAHPPLVESWLGVDFVEGRELFRVDASALRERLGPEWSGAWQRLEDASSSDDQQLGNVMGDRAVRLTERGFAFGWLGHGGEHYPRYEMIRDGFVAALDAVRDVTDRDGRALGPRRWTVRYVNRIPRGTVWRTPGDWSFFRLWQPVPLDGLGIEPDGFKGRWELPLEAERGALTVKFRHTSGAVEDDPDVVWLTLQARGPTDGSEAALFDGLDYGREMIVRAFNELVSVDAKAYWGVALRSR